MATIQIKGYDIVPLAIKDSYDRRAVQYRNNIVEILRKVGVKEEDIDVKLEVSAFRSAPAAASWYLDGHHLYFSYKLARKQVENLYIVFKIIELEVKAVLAGKKTIEEFISAFSEERDVEDKRKEARKVLGVEPEVTDLGAINAKYKDLAKKNHPDMPGGNAERFKEINNAHKILKRELE